MNASPLDRLVGQHKALGHPVRLRILALLRAGELCVCQITAVVRLAPSTVSAHLADLKRAGLVEERKSGRWVHYRLADRLPGALRPLWADLEGDEQPRVDAELLRRVGAVPLASLCRGAVDLDALAAKARRACCAAPAATQREARSSGGDPKSKRR
jgi:DNA-binding transcriptional ArsR family regulator